jgi:Domain of unknown function (DUF4288)
MAATRPGKHAAPQLTLPESRGLVGGLYSAKQLFEFCVMVDGHPGVRRLCEERLILVEGADARAALREAKRRGRASQHHYRNSDGNSVLFRFVGIMDLLHLGVECEANEVWYNITQRVRPMERRRSILPSEGKLNAIASERRITGASSKRRQRS